MFTERFFEKLNFGGSGGLAAEHIKVMHADTALEFKDERYAEMQNNLAFLHFNYIETRFSKAMAELFDQSHHPVLKICEPSDYTVLKGEKERSNLYVLGKGMDHNGHASTIYKKQVTEKSNEFCQKQVSCK